MKERRFIEENKAKWIEFEKLLDKQDSNPDRLSTLFVKINDDLSYARTFYPNRIIRLYLNNLSILLFNGIFGKRHDNKKGILYFIREELPYILYNTKKTLIVCYILLASMIAIGILSSYTDPDFYKIILGDRYIAMTEANIESGDPMAVYKHSKGDDMFMAISINNVRVAFITYITGILAGIGSIVVLAYNGIMVGAFQFFFIERGLFLESFLTIWMHGAIEVSLIAVECAAGLTLGKGLLFPGTLPRGIAFRLAARRSIKILIASVPLIVLAAIIESFVTRYTDIPDVLRASFIALSFGLVYYIFFYYPNLKARKGFLPEVIEKDQELPEPYLFKLEVKGLIKNTSQVIKDTFLSFYGSFGFIFRIVLFIAVINACLVYYLMLDAEKSISNGFSIINQAVYDLYDYSSSPLLFFINSLTIAILFYTALKTLSNAATQKFKLKIHALALILLLSFVLNASLYLTFFGVIIFIFLAPFFFSLVYIINNFDDVLSVSLKKCYRYLTKPYSNVFKFQVIITALCLLLLIFFDSPITYIYEDFILPFLTSNNELGNILYAVQAYFWAYLAITVCIILLFVGVSVVLHTNIEIIEAIALKEHVQKVFYSNKKKTFKDV